MEDMSKAFRREEGHGFDEQETDSAPLAPLPQAAEYRPDLDPLPHARAYLHNLTYATRRGFIHDRSQRNGFRIKPGMTSL